MSFLISREFTVRLETRVAQHGTFQNGNVSVKVGLNLSRRHVNGTGFRRDPFSCPEVIIRSSAVFVEGSVSGRTQVCLADCATVLGKLNPQRLRCPPGRTSAVPPTSPNTFLIHFVRCLDAFACRKTAGGCSFSPH